MLDMLKVVAAMLIWGSIGIFVRHLEIPSLEIAFLRAAIASLFLGLCGIWLWRKDGLKYLKNNLLLLTLSGLAIGLNWVFLFQAYRYTTIANATLSYYFAPVFVVLLSPFILKEKFTVNKGLSILAAILGMFLILKAQPSQANIAYEHLKGISYGLLAATLYASVILLNKSLKNLTGYEMTLIQIATAAIVLLPFVLSRNILHPGDISPLVIVIGIIHTGLAYVLYFSGMKGLQSHRIAMLSYVDPISAVVFGTLFLGELLTLPQLLGGVLILGSNFLDNIQINLKRDKRERTAG